MPDESCDLVYHSHVLEHFGKQEGKRFIGECFRVLKPGGIIRLAVPDLEGLVRQYLSMLERVTTDNSDLNRADYDWSVIELIDQMVRRQSGGEMFQYWQQPVIINEATVEARLGYEFSQWRQQWLTAGQPVQKAELARKSWLAGIKQSWLNLCLKTGKLSQQKIESAAFENSGEKHRWMYDCYALKLLLESAGFKQVKRVTAFDSSVPYWEQYQSLDLENGHVRKPDSLFMEGIKPTTTG